MSDPDRKIQELEHRIAELEEALAARDESINILHSMNDRMKDQLDKMLLNSLKLQGELQHYRQQTSP